MQHSGTVTAVSFHGAYLLSGSDDGTICVFQSGSWECKKVMKSHTDAITQVILCRMNQSHCFQFELLK